LKGETQNIFVNSKATTITEQMLIYSTFRLHHKSPLRNIAVIISILLIFKKSQLLHSIC